MKLFKQMSFAATLAAVLSGSAHANTPVFTPGKLAVLQFGDGGTNRNLPLNGGSVAIPYTNYFASDIMGCRQTQYFVDQFEPNGINQTNPTVQLAIPTNDVAGGLFANGNAGTEGVMTLSGDKSVLTFAGYSGDMLSDVTGQQTAPSNLSYSRGIATVDAFTNYTRVYSGGAWYGIATGKTNPRGVATDGIGHFWGCGNGYGSMYYDATTGETPFAFQNVDLTSCVKVINNAVYTSVKAGDVQNGLYPAGIYTFVDNGFNPVPYPNFLTFLQLYLAAQAPFTNNIGFDINPQGTVAYMADVGSFKKNAIEIGGIQKYVKTGNAWRLAYNLAIPGYTNQTVGILANAANTNVLVGCFSVTVDWSGTNPVIYATTSDCGNDNGDPYYGNRVIRINDTNTISTGASIILTTNMNILTTVARPGKDANGSAITNMVYKSVTFTPDIRPTIVTNPASWSAAVGDTISFSVFATSSYTMGYSWLSNGVPVSSISNPSAATAALTFNSVGLTYSNTTYQCVVTNVYGAVTSSVATLVVTPSAVVPVLGALQQVTNYVGNSVLISANVSGTDPKSYQWYYAGNLIADGASASGGIYVGTTVAVLTINNAQSGDAGLYSVVVTNIAGLVSNGVANLILTYAPPAIVVPPAATTTFIGQNISFNVSAYDGTVNGASLSYQWYSSKANGTSLQALTAGEYSGAQSATLNVTGAIVNDATNYVVVVSNSGGSVTSPPVALTLMVQPAHTFVSYTNPSSAYVQNFDSLPVNGGGSADAANPNPIQTETNFTVLDLTTGGPLNAYSLNNPFDFGYPIIPQGLIGGLGVTNMSGWYGWSSAKLQFGATYGDQSAGGIIDLGQNYYSPSTVLTGVTNRALGMISTTKSGYVAFGVALINKTSNTITNINLSFVGELWRNNPAQQVVGFSYAIDTAGTNSTFSPGTPDVVGSLSLTTVPGLNLAFATNAVTAILDGTLSTNQVSLGTNGLAIGNWPPGSALWLVWESQNPTGGAQAVAIDNLSFSASSAVASPILPINITASSAHITGSGATAAAQFSFTNAPGLTFSVLATNNIAAPKTNWPVIGTAVESPAGHYQFTDPNPATNSTRFYILRQP